MGTVAEEVAALRGTRPATLRDLLTDSSFSRLARAMLVSSLGDWVGFVAVAALVARLGGARLGGLAVAGVMLARLLPSVLFGPFAGVLADRFDRRTLMVRADVARGAMYASMPFMPGLWAIFLLSFFIECLSLLWTPAKDASIPNLVPRRQLANANSVGLITTYGTLPLGASVYTALAATAAAIGTKVPYFRSRHEFLALWLDALTFGFSAWMVSGLQLGRTASEQVRLSKRAKLDFTSALDEVRQGYRFLRSHSLVRAMTIGIVVGFAGVGSVISIGPIFAGFTLHSPVTGFGFLITAFGVGMAAGMAAVNLLGRRVEKDILFAAAMLGAGACLLVLAAMPSIALAALFAVPMGMAVGLTWVSGYTMLQENVTDEFRGRTFATLTITSRMTLFGALVVFPSVASAIGPHAALSVAGRTLSVDGNRVALWLGALVVVGAATASRRGLKRSRLARPRPLSLLPRWRRRERQGGLFVVFEGVEGAGKGTQIELARRFVQSTGRDVVVTREPGGTELGDRLRDAILDPATGHVDPRAEALLFAACRAQHVITVIRPALEEGKVVLCDRFIDSSLAYQGAGRGLGEQDVLTLNAWATQGLFPDLVVLLHLEPDQGLARASGRVSTALDRIESEELEFHARVSDAYLRIADENPDRVKLIDARGTPEEVHERVRAVLKPALSLGDEGRAGPT